MFTPLYIEFKGFVVIGANFFFLENYDEHSDIIGNSEKTPHICTNIIMFLICASFCKIGVMD